MKMRNANRRGIALLSVVVMGAFAIAISMSMYELLLKVSRSEMSSTMSRELRNAADIGVDYAVQQLNNSVALGLPCPVYNIVKDVPADYLSSFQTGTVKVKIRDLSADEKDLFKKYCPIYSVALDNSLATVNNVTFADYNVLPRTNVSFDFWRVVEVTASRSSFSRSLKVYLEPRFDKPAGKAGYVVTTGASAAPVFSNTFFGNSAVNFTPVSGTLVVNSDSQPIPKDFNPDPDITETYYDYPLKVQSNKLVNFGKNAATQLNGDVVVSNNNGSAPAAVVTTSQSGSEMPTIAGRVQTNAGDGSNTTSLGDFTVNTGATLNPSDPIQASADLASSQGSRLFLNTNPITQGASENQLAPAPVPYDSSASPLPSLENGASLKGSYYTSNLATGSDAVSIQESTKIFIQDGASSGPAVDIDTSILSNSGAGNVASKFQIYYSGSRPVNIDLNADFNGLIYAPNATVTLKRTKNLIGPRNFTGALVGNEVNLSTAGDTTVTILSNPATANNTLDDTPSAGSVSYLSKDGQPLLQGYKAVTWQEYNFVLVN